MDHGGGAPLRERHVERLEDELRAQMRRHRPAYDALAPRVDDHGEVEKARPGRNVRDVGDPQAIRAPGGEVPGPRDLAPAVRRGRGAW